MGFEVRIKEEERGGVRRLEGENVRRCWRAERWESEKVGKYEGEELGRRW